MFFIVELFKIENRPEITLIYLCDAMLVRSMLSRMAQSVRRSQLVFYWNGWTNQAVIFWHIGFPRLILHCVI